MKILFFAFLLTISTWAQAGPLRLALNWKPEPQFGGFYAAQDFFKKEKLEVQIQPGGSGTPTIQMLGAGQAEYALVSADEVLLALDRGSQDLVAVFATFQTNPQAVMTHAEAGYQNLADLLKDEKATLLGQAGLPYALFLKKKTPIFKVKTAPYLGGIANFQNDKSVAQQCFVTSEPLAAAKAKIAVKSFLVADAGYNPYTTVLVTKASRYKEHPDEVKKIVASVRQGWAAYLLNPEPTNHSMQALNKAMDPATFQESAQAQAPLIQTAETQAHGLGWMTEERWQTLASQLKELGLVSKPVNVKSLFLNL